MNIKYLRALILVLLFSCSEKEVEIKFQAEATINDLEFKTNTNSATLMPISWDIRLEKDASNYIIIRLNSDIEGVYPVFEVKGGPRTNAQEKMAYVECVLDGSIYYGVTGSITITKNSNETISGTFSFNSKNDAGTISTVNEGKFTEIDISDWPTGICRIDHYGDNDFSYDLTGKLTYSRANLSDTETFYSYDLNGNPIKKMIVSSASVTMTEVEYGVNGANRIINYNEQGIKIYDRSIVYIDGKVTSINVSFGTTCGYNFTYSGLNLAQFEASCFGNLTTIKHLDYDNKNSPGILFRQALGDQNGLVLLFPDTFLNMSPNNVGKTEQENPSVIFNYAYQYNSNNYPTKVTQTFEGNSYEFNISYQGCN
jgi:hypothetical protein